MTLKIFIYGIFFMIFAVSCNKQITDPETMTPQTAALKAGVIGAKYYVAKSGSNSNAGTLTSPWLTIQKGADAAVAGDTVFVKAGTYPEYVKFTASGTAGNNIVLKNYGNDVVNIDAGNTRVYCLYTNSQSYITVDGINILNSTTYNIPINGGHDILLKNIKSTLPLASMIPHIEFPANPYNVTLQNITTYGGSYGVYIGTEVDNINIIGGDFSYAAVDGISVYGGGSVTKNITVDGAYCHHNERQGIDMAHCQYITVRNSHCAYNAASGIQIEAQGNNSLIEDNLCENNCRGGGYANSDYETGIWIYNTDVSIVRRNTIRGNQTGLRFLQASNFQGYSNVITNNTYHPSTFPATQNTSGVDFSQSSGTFYNNVLFGNAASDSKLGSLYVYPDGTSSLVINNNIVMNDGSSKDMGFDQSTGSSVVSDYNMVYNAGRAVNIQQGGTTRTWASYKTASGQDAHSFNSNPLFVNSTNYNLQSTSPAINTGVNVGLTSDCLKNSLVGVPDIGAYEFASTASTPTTTTPTPITPTPTPITPTPTPIPTVTPTTVYYNAQVSATATKNDCGTGYTGSTVTYTVAANVYSSNISQADADNQAIADLKLNEQVYANANGTCTQKIVRKKRRH